MRLRSCSPERSCTASCPTTDLEHALSATADPRYAGDSLCCGRFGRAAILRLAAGLRDEPRWLGPAAALEGRALAARRADGGYSFGDALGLFNGAAGVGLALLDATLAPDERVLPSVLSAGLSGASPRGPAMGDAGLEPATSALSRRRSPS